MKLNVLNAFKNTFSEVEDAILVKYLTVKSVKVLLIIVPAVKRIMVCKKLVIRIKPYAELVITLSVQNVHKVITKFVSNVNQIFII